MLFNSFFSGIPSTKSYEAALLDNEAKYAAYVETLESEEYRQYNRLKEYLANPAPIKKERQQAEAKIAQAKKKLAAFDAETKNKKFKSVKQLKKEYRIAPVRTFRLWRSKKAAAEAEAKKAALENRRKLFDAAVQQLEVERTAYYDKRKLSRNQTVQEIEKCYSAKKQVETDYKNLKTEFRELKNSKKIVDFFKFRKNNAQVLAEMERWVLKFYEDFTKIDPRWSDKQLVSELMMNGSPYSPIEDLHIFNPSNIQQQGTLLKIRTKTEQKQGLAWDKTVGFIPKTFAYTSGLFSTAHSFNQLYGKFEAKVQVAKASGIYHAFWLGTNRQKPHINVFKYEGGNLSVSAYSKDATVEHKLDCKLKDDFYIYTLLWSAKN
jgi:chemotaxis protein histidine kinase CheA